MLFNGQFSGSAQVKVVSQSVDQIDDRSQASKIGVLSAKPNQIPLAVLCQFKVHRSSGLRRPDQCCRVFFKVKVKEIVTDQVFQLPVNASVQSVEASK